MADEKGMHFKDQRSLEEKLGGGNGVNKFFNWCELRNERNNFWGNNAFMEEFLLGRGLMSQGDKMLE